MYPVPFISCNCLWCMPTSHIVCTPENPYTFLVPHALPQVKALTLCSPSFPTSNLHPSSLLFHCLVASLPQHHIHLPISVPMQNRGSLICVHPQVASLPQHHIHLPIPVPMQNRGSLNCMHPQQCCAHTASFKNGTVNNDRK